MARETNELAQELQGLRIADRVEIDIMNRHPLPPGIQIRYPVTARQHLGLGPAEEVD